MHVWLCAWLCAVMCGCVCVAHFSCSNPSEVDFFFRAVFFFFLPGSAILSKDVVCVVLLTYIRSFIVFCALIINCLQSSINTGN